MTEITVNCAIAGQLKKSIIQPRVLKPIRRTSAIKKVDHQIPKTFTSNFDERQESNAFSCCSCQAYAVGLDYGQEPGIF